MHKPLYCTWNLEFAKPDLWESIQNSALWPMLRWKQSLQWRAFHLLQGASFITQAQVFSRSSLVLHVAGELQANWVFLPPGSVVLLVVQNTTLQSDWARKLVRNFSSRKLVQIFNPDLRPHDKPCIQDFTLQWWLRWLIQCRFCYNVYSCHVSGPTVRPVFIAAAIYIVGSCGVWGDWKSVVAG